MRVNGDAPIRQHSPAPAQRVSPRQIVGCHHDRHAVGSALTKQSRQDRARAGVLAGGGFVQQQGLGPGGKHGRYRYPPLLTGAEQLRWSFEQ